MGPRQRLRCASGRVAALTLASALAASVSCDDKNCPDDACKDAAVTEPEPDGAAVDADAPRVVEGDAVCAMQSIRATRGQPKPVDVVFVVDNSGSMSEEIAAIRENINRDFAEIVAQSGVDYRVVMISRFGLDGTGLCIAPPLSGAPCASGLAAAQSAVFHHYDQEIGSEDAFCQLLATFDRPDATGLAPQGWQSWLRKDAHKALVVITDDSARCQYMLGEQPVAFGQPNGDAYADALSFHSALLARSGEHFGVPPDVKYQFFSIVGLAQNTPVTEPYFPHDGLVAKTCDTAPSVGASYQALSIVTDALRYPVCEGRSFDAVFRALASSVIQASKRDCVFELPDAPEWSVIDTRTVNLEFHPSDGPARRFTQVDSGAECEGEGSFYIRDRIELCPGACRVVQADSAPEINILYGCTAIPQ